MFKLALISAALMFTPPAPVLTSTHTPQSASCSGCGCKGGPGWRINRTGKCASHKNIRKECGNPPSPRRCTKENG